MKKLYLLNLLFLCVAIGGLIATAISIFEDMNPDNIIVGAVVTGIGLVGACGCTIARVIKDKGKQ